jgi:hypothetical protein
MYSSPSAQKNGRKTAPKEANRSTSSRLGCPAYNIGGRFHWPGLVGGDVESAALRYAEEKGQG